MLAEGLQIYFSIVKVFAGGGKLKYFYILGWGKCRLFTHLICFYYYSKLSLKANELVNYLISNTYLILKNTKFVDLGRDLIKLLRNWNECPLVL